MPPNSSFLQIDFWQEILKQSLHWFITSGPTILVICAIGVIAFKGISLALGRLKRWLLRNTGLQTSDLPTEVEKRLNTLIGMLQTVLRILLGLLLTVLILKELGVDIAPLIAGAGVAGIAVGFGAQSFVRDLIAGFSMLIENHLREGDVVRINGTDGLVEKIGLRTIVLRDISGVVHVFSNGSINTLSNLTKDWSAMVFDVGVAYKEDTDRVSGIMRQVAEELRADKAFGDKIIAPLKIFGVDKFADSAVIIKARLKTTPRAQWDVGREYNRRLKKAFDKEGIEFPFPHISVYAGEQSKPFPVSIDRVQ